MRFLFICTFIVLNISFLNAAVMQQGEFYKDKQELKQLKRELNTFYDQKEAKYKKEQKDLETLLNKTKLEREKIEKLKAKNEKIKAEITREITSRATVLYDKMKVKVALDIFKTMVADGKINEVFDIMIRLKQKRVLELLKKFDVPTKTTLMDKMEKYDYEQAKKGK